MPCFPHFFSLRCGTEHAAWQASGKIGNIGIILPPHIIVDLEAEDRLQAFLKVGGMRIGAHTGGINETDHAARRLAEAGEDIHFVSSGLPVERVELAEDLQARLGGIVELASDTVEINFDVAESVIAGTFDDVFEEFLCLGMVWHEPVSSIGMKPIRVHEILNAECVCLDRIRMGFHPRMLGVHHEWGEPHTGSPADIADFFSYGSQAAWELRVRAPVAIHFLVTVVDL